MLIIPTYTKWQLANYIDLSKLMPEFQAPAAGERKGYEVVFSSILFINRNSLLSKLENLLGSKNFTKSTICNSA
jgi:hypothetical protein